MAGDGLERAHMDSRAYIIYTVLPQNSTRMSAFWSWSLKASTPSHPSKTLQKPLAWKHGPYCSGGGAGRFRPTQAQARRSQRRRPSPSLRYPGSCQFHPSGTHVTLRPLFPCFLGLYFLGIGFLESWVSSQMGFQGVFARPFRMTGGISCIWAAILVVVWWIWIAIACSKRTSNVRTSASTEGGDRKRLAAVWKIAAFRLSVLSNESRTRWASFKSVAFSLFPFNFSLLWCYLIWVSFLIWLESSLMLWLRWFILELEVL